MHLMIRVRKNKMAYFFGRSNQMLFFFLQEAVAYKALKANNHTSVSHEEQIARRGR